MAGKQVTHVTAPGNAPWVLTVGASSHMGTTDRDDDTTGPDPVPLAQGLAMGVARRFSWSAAYPVAVPSVPSAPPTVASRSSKRRFSMTSDCAASLSRMRTTTDANDEPVYARSRPASTPRRHQTSAARPPADG